MQVTVYTKPDCHLCDEVLTLLDRLRPQYKIELTEVNILEDMALYEEYGTKIPVVVAGSGKLGRLVAPITEAELRAYLELERRTSMPPLPQYTETRVDRTASYIGRHWLGLVCITLGIFTVLPWLAPIFAWLGWWDLANPIYTAYALTCHQLPERAGSVFDYQVAFCYRNTALYGGIFLFGILFGLARDRKAEWLRWLRKPLPWWGFVLFLVPMMADGLTHMFGLRAGIMIDAMPMDVEFGTFLVGSQIWSLNWWLRVLTGGLAAMGTVWFAFSRMERAVEEAEALRLMYARSPQTQMRDA